MARILLTAIAAEIRGKLNGNVFTRNKGGLVLRNKVTPINPRTAAQQTQRAYMADTSKAWAANLSDAQRNGWKTFGQQAGRTNIFGNGLILSGIAGYQAINRIVLNSGGSRVDDAPISKEVAAILSASLQASRGPNTLTITFSPTPLVAPQGAYVFATPALSPGISNVSNSLRFIGFFSAAASTLDILSAWESKFGTFPVTAGQRIAATIQVVDNTTGAISAPFGVSNLVS